MRGIPCHAWGLKCFKLIAEHFGSYIKCDDHTLSRFTMDEARILIKSRQHAMVNEVCMVTVDGSSYSMFVKKDIS